MSSLLEQVKAFIADPRGEIRFEELDKIKLELAKRLSEAEAVEANYAKKIAELEDKLAECQAVVERLTGEIVELAAKPKVPKDPKDPKVAGPSLREIKDDLRSKPTTPGL